MKKLFLLLSIGSIGLTATAQESTKSVVFTTNQVDEALQKLTFDQARVKQLLSYTRSVNAPDKSVANKTTSVQTKRWYNYGDYFDTTLIDGGNSASISGVIIWNDTLGEALYTSGLAHNRQVSVGSILHPQIAGFNDVNYYPGEMHLDTLNAYNVDSIRIYGNHNINPAKTGVVDTIIITAGKGANIHNIRYTGMTARYGVDTLNCSNLRYDSVANTEALGLGAPVVTTKFPITAAMWGDTLSDGTFVMKLPVSITAAAGEMVGMSLTFKSGDASFPTTVPGDTIDAFTNVYMYNSFYPLSIFKLVGTSPAFAPYNQNDRNEGLFKTLPSYLNGYATQYVPMWAWSTSGGTAASYLQHIYLDWHVTCSNCTTIGVNEVVKNITNNRVYPNPAEDQVTVAFNLVNATSATVSLTNTLGQVVASQVVTNGKASFNTTAIPSGIYIYTINANGEQTTGRVAVAH